METDAHGRESEAKEPARKKGERPESSHPPAMTVSAANQVASNPPRRNSRRRNRRKRRRRAGGGHVTALRDGLIAGPVITSAAPLSGLVLAAEALLLLAFDASITALNTLRLQRIYDLTDTLQLLYQFFPYQDANEPCQQ